MPKQDGALCSEVLILSKEIESNLTIEEGKLQLYQEISQNSIID